jgi:precorrin-2 methylase
LQVKLGETVSNTDAALGTPGTVNTLLSNEQISFSCFQGDRTYYTEVIKLQNTTTSETWKVDLDLESDVVGQAAITDTFTTGNADIWLFTSEVNSTLVTERPNPTNYGSLAQWHDSATQKAIQLEVVAGVLQSASSKTADITIPAGESRTLALVVDCGADMVVGEAGTFRVTVNARPQ